MSGRKAPKQRAPAEAPAADTPAKKAKKGPTVVPRAPAQTEEESDSVQQVELNKAPAVPPPLSVDALMAAFKQEVASLKADNQAAHAEVMARTADVHKAVKHSNQLAETTAPMSAPAKGLTKAMSEGALFSGLRAGDCSGGGVQYGGGNVFTCY